MPREQLLFLCDCEGSMALDRGRLEKAAGKAACRYGSFLCTREAARVKEALQSGNDVMVACGQEAPFFLELAEELGAEGRVTAVDIRDRAGWSDEAEAAGPKMAALLAASRVGAPPVGSLSIRSEGVCLVYGSGEAALQAARDLSDQLAVTLMLQDIGDAIQPAIRMFPILSGRVRTISGSLGKFEVMADGVSELLPGGRGGMRFGPSRDGGMSDCDLVLDLSGEPPLVAGYRKRDGYFRVDPADPAAVARAMFEIVQYVGSFEKPLYINFDASLCAHSRSEKTGCTRCLDVCPAGAIHPDGETVAIDSGICAGCGACASVCPSGAASYALPGEGAYRMRLEATIRAYEEAGGKGARVLLHGAGDAEALIAAAARYGRGLPADVLPLQLNEPTQINHGDLLGGLVAGASQVVVLVPERVRRDGEIAGLESQVELVRALLRGVGEPETRVLAIESDDPDGLSDQLYESRQAPVGWERAVPLGDRRAVTRLAMMALAPQGEARPEAIPLPEGAPYGRVEFNADACTLCLACASQCPTGALRDNPDRPQLLFDEDACVQCGICVATCPESALKLEPRYALADEARHPVTLKEEEPFACVSCGKPFGTKSVIGRILEQLGGQHWMFPDDARSRMIQMCADCRVQAQYHTQDSPFRMGERPRVRTTDDYLAEREEQRRQQKTGKPNGSGAV